MTLRPELAYMLGVYLATIFRIGSSLEGRLLFGSFCLSLILISIIFFGLEGDTP